MNKRKKIVIFCVTMIGFAIAAMAAFKTLIYFVLPIDSIIYLNWIDSIGTLVIIIIVFFLSLRLKKASRNRKKQIIIINILTLSLFVFTFSQLSIQLFKQSGKTYFGNNTNVSTYGIGIPKKGYGSLKEAMKEMETEKGFKELYRFESETYAAVFYKSNTAIYTDEFLIQEGIYYKFGGRRIIFKETNYYEYEGKKVFYENAEDSTNYSDKETMLADIEQCLNASKSKVFNRTNQYPAYGVVGTEKIENVKINGQKVDVVKEIKDEEGKIWYFWLVKNLQKRNIEHIKIRGL